MKRKLFIGSSGEHVAICQKIKERIEATCSDWLEVDIWKGSGIFVLNKGTLEALAQAAREFDYGVFVAAPDDCLFKRRKAMKVTRDNVLFEAGLFMGALGLSRTFIVASSKVSLPSDFNGSTVIMYKGAEPGAEELDLLVDTLVKTKECYRMDHMHSTPLAYGYYEGFVKPIMHTLSEEGDIELSIFVPHSVSELRERIRQHRNETGALEVRKDERLVHCVKDGDGVSYWDIPRCLRTQDGLVGYSKHKTEIGRDTDWNQWMSRELENFCDVLHALLEEEKLYDQKVHVSRL